MWETCCKAQGGQHVKEKFGKKICFSKLLELDDLKYTS